ncbi:proteoglycan 4-like [Microplitis mediator]|uniref:proteoglycan 4-like n=1 Tax=Microplitis mediator TaxID=375433 RepID=UPI002555D2E8|nr:proteoglycan 4-like [Microplitis mediator]
MSRAQSEAFDKRSTTNSQMDAKGGGDLTTGEDQGLTKIVTRSTTKQQSSGKPARLRRKKRAVKAEPVEPFNPEPAKVVSVESDNHESRETVSNEPAKGESVKPRKPNSHEPTKVETVKPRETVGNEPAEVEPVKPRKAHSNEPAKVESAKPRETVSNEPAKGESVKPKKPNSHEPTKVETVKPKKPNGHDPTKVESAGPRSDRQRPDEVRPAKSRHDTESRKNDSPHKRDIKAPRRGRSRTPPRDRRLIARRMPTPERRRFLRAQSRHRLGHNWERHLSSTSRHRLEADRMSWRKKATTPRRHIAVKRMITKIPEVESPSEEETEQTRQDPRIPNKGIKWELRAVDIMTTTKIMVTQATQTDQESQQKPLRDISSEFLNDQTPQRLPPTPGKGEQSAESTSEVKPPKPRRKRRRTVEDLFG